MFYVAFLLALVVGVVLGIIGSGGSILTVPILVYFLDLNATSATSYSLFIVGLSAIVGVHRFYNSHLINYRLTFFFGFPSIIGVLISRKLIIPNLPLTIDFFQFFSFTKDELILVFFGIVMLVGAISMLLSIKPNIEHNIMRKNIPILIIVDGIIIGIITGFVGAGGGFLIVPALILLTNIRVKEAIGTSLAIISIKSILGFISEINNVVDWNFLLIFTSFSIVGVILGTRFSILINSNVLKKSFGIFVLFVAIAIIIKEILI